MTVNIKIKYLFDGKFLTHIKSLKAVDMPISFKKYLFICIFFCILIRYQCYLGCLYVNQYTYVHIYKCISF